MSSRKNPLLAAPTSLQSPTPAQQSVPASDPPTNLTPDLAPDLDPADFYFDGPYLVFTAAYHLKRGACCHSGCRHCPYRDTLED